MPNARTCFIILAFACAQATSAAAAEQRPADCAGYGSNFVAVPGTNTCLRIAGRVRAEAGAARRERMRPSAAGRADLDLRTLTDYGPVRTFVRVGAGRR